MTQFQHVPLLRVPTALQLETPSLTPSIHSPSLFEADSDSSLSDLSSELSSVRSMSPSTRYPSPASSQETTDTTQLDGATASSNQKRKRPNSVDEAAENTPLAKKRQRKSEPKPRQRLNLDLTTLADEEQREQLEVLMKVLRKRRKIVVVAGAGISVSAGIPDFRSSTGLFKSLKTTHNLQGSGKQLFDASVYQTDTATTTFHAMVRQMSAMVNSAAPTAFHKMLSTLSSEGRLLRLYTQNVDGIDSSLPHLETSVPLAPKGPWPKTVQLHGGLEKMVCSKCQSLSRFDPDLFEGATPPPCPNCEESDRLRTNYAGKRSHGIGRLRPRIVLYNEHNPDEEAIGACASADLKTRPDAIIVVGTSMKIPGVRRIVREMCGVVGDRRDGLRVWVNQDGPPLGAQFEDCWDLIVKGASDQVAGQWTKNIQDEEESRNSVCTESDMEKARSNGGVSVVIPNSSQETDSTLPTPAATPRKKSPSAPAVVQKTMLKLKAPTSKAKGKKPASTKGGTTKAMTAKTKAKQTAKSTVKKASTAANSSTKARAKTGPQTGTLKAQFKVSKSSATAATSSKTKISLITKAPAPSTPKKSPVKQRAMAPLSPGEARNNGPNLTSTRWKRDPIFPNLGKSPKKSPDICSPLKTSSAENISHCEGPRRGSCGSLSSGLSSALSDCEDIQDDDWKRKSQQGQVSPTSVPKGMEKLIH